MTSCEPVSQTFLTAEWRNLVMFNYAVEADLLSAYVPRDTELDEWNGTTFLSLVAFSFLNTRVKRLAIPFHRNFEEINLRFYVRARGADGWRRGVVFIREVVPRRAISTIARWWYNENYVTCPTRSRQSQNGNQRKLEYGWRHQGQWLSLEATSGGAAIVPEAGSEEEFITEHYWGYSSQRNGSTVEYRVDHPRWQVWMASSHAARGDFASFYGSEIAHPLAQIPTSVFIADGSAVAVKQGTRFTPT